MNDNSDSGDDDSVQIVQVVPSSGHFSTNPRKCKQKAQLKDYYKEDDQNVPPRRPPAKLKSTSKDQDSPPMPRQELLHRTGSEKELHALLPSVEKKKEESSEDDDDDDDDLPFPSAKSTLKSIMSMSLSTSSDEDDEKRAVEARERVEQILSSDPSMIKLREAVQKAKLNMDDRTQILENEAEIAAERQFLATRRTHFDIRPVWGAPSEEMPTLPPIVTIERTSKITQVHHVNTQLIKQLKFENPKDFTVDLRQYKQLLSNVAHVSKLIEPVLEAELHYGGVEPIKIKRSKKMILLRVRSPLGALGEEYDEFRVGEDDPFSKLMELYFEKQKERVSLHFDGDILQPQQTPNMTNLVHGDLIESKAVKEYGSVLRK